MPKNWNITALRQLDHQFIQLACFSVVFGKTRTETAGLNADDGVLLGIVIGRTTKDFNPDHGLLQLDVLTFKVPFDDELKESRKPFVPRKPGASEYPLELFASGWFLYFDRCSKFAHYTSGPATISVNANVLQEVISLHESKQRDCQETLVAIIAVLRVNNPVQTHPDLSFLSPGAF